MTVPGRRAALAWLGGAAATAALTVWAPGAAHAAPLRIVSLDLQLTEMLVSLGTPPVAASDNALYRRLIGRPDLPGTVADLGPLQQPNLEFLQSLAPDLIVVPAWMAESGREPLARIARIAAPGSLAAMPALDRLDTTFRQIAALVARSPEADLLIARRDTVFDATRAIISPHPTILCRFVEDGRHLAWFGSKSVVGAVAERVGLTLVAMGRQSGFGTGVAAIEDLAAHPAARIIHFDRGAETARALSRLSQSPLWQALPMVRREQVFGTPVIHPNGGVASATRFAEQLAASQGAKAGHA